MGKGAGESLPAVAAIRTHAGAVVLVAIVLGFLADLLGLKLGHEYARVDGSAAM